LINRGDPEKSQNSSYLEDKRMIETADSLAEVLQQTQRGLHKKMGQSTEEDLLMLGLANN